MYSRSEIENILFLDIETASATQHFSELSERMQTLWEKKADILNRRASGDPQPADELWQERAAIFSEFGKVICISCGYLRFQGDQPVFKAKSWYGEDEAEVLSGFAEMLKDYVSKNPGVSLCAHNGKEFDFPYMGRRYIINRLPVPGPLAVQGKKPWETKFIDTMELWKFGDFKSWTSLDLLCAVLDVPTPKDDIDGSDVGRVFYEEQDYKRIADYCEKDVLATAQVMLRFCGEKIVQATLGTH